jgi:uncharacterized protein
MRLVWFTMATLACLAALPAAADSQSDRPPPPLIVGEPQASAPSEVVQGDAARRRGDLQEAVRLYKMAAAKGERGAENDIGALYDNGGPGLPADGAEAMRWFHLGAEHGDPWAALNLGWNYSRGHGVAKDDVEALRWYRLSAAGGNSFAQQNVGAMYAAGAGGAPQDYVEAIRWYRLAAQSGNPSAETNLGMLYYSGRGVPRDYAEAGRWFQKVADQADNWADYSEPKVTRMVAGSVRTLGLMYADGQGVVVDLDHARRLMTKAAALGDDLAKEWLAHHPATP